MGNSVDMTLTLRHKILIGIGAAILIGLGIYLTRDEWMPRAANISYNDKNFSFNYPREHRIQEFARGTVIVGNKQDDVFTPLVEVIVYQSDPDAALPVTFDAYMERQALALCGSDSVEKITCSNVIAAPYTNAQGLLGQQLSLTLTRENLESGTSTTETFGPVYVFNTTRFVADPADTLRYRAIFVYPSFASVVAASTSPALLAHILDSLTIPGGISTVTSR